MGRGVRLLSSGDISGDKAKGFEFTSAGAPSPQIDGELSSQGDNGLLLLSHAIAKAFSKFEGRMPGRVPAEKAPDRFDQLSA